MIDIKVIFQAGKVNELYNDKIDENINGLEKFLKLYNYQTLTNMHLFDYNDKLKNLKVVNGEERDGDVLHSLASIEKAKTLLNYYPKYDFKKGLKKTISWYLKKNES